jgi:enoyl-CoA hydratase/carnithine racemase
MTNVAQQTASDNTAVRPGPSQFNTDRTHPGRWTITFDNPPINMFVPATIVELRALMTELEADRSVI